MTSTDLRQRTFCFAVAAATLSVLTVALPAQAFDGGAGFDFAAVDADKNGQITQTEMDTFRAARAAGMDIDKDGFISAEEMTAQMMARTQERLEKLARHAIVEQDKDGDGKVSLAEMGADKGPDKLMTRADANGDGALSQEEIDRMRAQMQERHTRKENKNGGWGRGHGGGMSGPFWLFGSGTATE